MSLLITNNIMKQYGTVCLALLVLLLAMPGCSGIVRVTDLQVEMKTNPLGLDINHPRFSWKSISFGRDVQQVAYRIQVASSEKNLIEEDSLLWDSEIVDSDASIFVNYAGKPLQSEKIYYWRVRIKTNHGQSNWSRINHWSMAFLNQSEWKAEWIGLDSLTNVGENMTGRTRLAARYLRKEFQTSRKVKRATLYICGLGLYQAYINGQAVTQDVLVPTVSWYMRRVYYNTYDVTKLVLAGKNILAVKLGNGRFFQMRTNVSSNIYGFPKLLSQLVIEYYGNTRDEILSDSSWKLTTHGPIIANNEYDGEEYDARKEMPGWTRTGYNDSFWDSAHIVESPHDTVPFRPADLMAQPNPSICINELVKPVSIRICEDGRYLVDMGQNMCGWVEVHLYGKKGQPVTITYAEELTSNGDSLRMVSMYQRDPSKKALVRDIYVPANNGLFKYEPTFSYRGFRYIQITGVDCIPKTYNIIGKQICDDMETTGVFSTSDSVLNRIYNACYWSIKDNYHGMPTDCPQRAERQGWLGDRATCAYGEAYLFNNEALYEKWEQDINDSRSQEGLIGAIAPRFWTIYNKDVTWPAAAYYVTDMLYHHYGDVEPIIRHYEMLKTYLRWIENNTMSNYIVTKDQYGDWCFPCMNLDSIRIIGDSNSTAAAVLSTTYYYDLLNKMVVFAELSGHNEDISYFQDLAAKVKVAYNQKYFHTDLGYYDNNTVTANLLGLRFGLVPQGYEEKVFQNIVDRTEGDFKGHISVGLIGIQHLMRALTEYGRSDLALKIATSVTYPSWGYMLKRGATTIWELWNGDTAGEFWNGKNYPGCTSRNHVMLIGDLLIWFYEDLAGIKCAPDAVAFKKLLMAPVFPDKLDNVNASYTSVYGEIKSSWSKKNGQFHWDITLPTNTSAIVRIPNKFNVVKKVGRGIRSVRNTNKYVEYVIGSGTYRFKGK